MNISLSSAFEIFSWRDCITCKILSWIGVPKLQERHTNQGIRAFQKIALRIHINCINLLRERLKPYKEMMISLSGYSLPACKILLIATNVALLSFVVLLLVDHCLASHKLTSWASIFHILTCCWLAIRGSFWISTLTSSQTWDAFSFYILYWIPNPIEFGSFMLLPLFFAQIIYPNEWQRYWACICPVYTTLIVSFVSFQALWALLAAYEETMKESCYKKHHNPNIDCFHTEYSSNIFRFSTAFSFLLLAILQSLYAVRVHYMDSKQYQRYMISSRTSIAIVNGLLILSFLSRTFYQFGALLDLFHLPNIPLQGNEDVHYSIVVVFIVWDYLPTLLLISTVTSRVFGDNTYYANSILQLSWISNSVGRMYPGKNRSGDKNKRARGVRYILVHDKYSNMCWQVCWQREGSWTNTSVESLSELWIGRATNDWRGESVVDVSDES